MDYLHIKIEGGVEGSGAVCQRLASLPDQRHVHTANTPPESYRTSRGQTRGKTVLEERAKTHGEIYETHRES
jgi:hypothetical protein